MLLTESLFCVSLQSQMNMVPIVQLVRASDCGSECRRFESDWAHPSKSLKSIGFQGLFVYIAQIRQCGENRRVWVKSPEGTEPEAQDTPNRGRRR